ncbi:flagellar basal body rod protein FlgB [Fulvimonas sp. R45]|uniref:flagellar basal body rod protein FlgB n=1 Tax=Fulvimonas sp. R45 TaxID=3045937 RepID=UPI00265E2639|nr:flagellar basal body rod protein FlgB [Fulvimonas sp. R45]MDO1528335.1 flagellar basal body rod protein FlgB [Fulvimonas sp. R45]
MNLDNLFGMHTQALALWQRRAEVLSGNLANADTPGYLARDVDFRALLSGAGAGAPLPLDTTSPGQIGGAAPGGAMPLSYRVPTQPSLDGNTVDSQLESAAFAANGVHYQASLAFITAQIHMLRTAITGDQG